MTDRRQVPRRTVSTSRVRILRLMCRRVTLPILGAVCLVTACWESNPVHETDLSVLDSLAVEPPTGDDSPGGKRTVAFQPTIIHPKEDELCGQARADCDDGDGCTYDYCDPSENVCPT